MQRSVCVWAGRELPTSEFTTIGVLVSAIFLAAWIRPLPLTHLFSNLEISKEKNMKKVRDQFGKLTVTLQLLLRFSVSSLHRDFGFKVI